MEKAHVYGVDPENANGIALAKVLISGAVQKRMISLVGFELTPIAEGARVARSVMQNLARYVESEGPKIVYLDNPIAHQRLESIEVARKVYSSTGLPDYSRQEESRATRERKFDTAYWAIREIKTAGLKGWNDIREKLDSLFANEESERLNGLMAAIRHAAKTIKPEMYFLNRESVEFLEERIKGLGIDVVKL